MTIIITDDDVKRLLPMAECIEVMAEALASLARGEVHNPLRFVVRPPDAPSLPANRISTVGAIAGPRSLSV